jgi:hypothetical protein
VGRGEVVKGAKYQILLMVYGNVGRGEGSVFNKFGVWVRDIL